MMAFAREPWKYASMPAAASSALTYSSGSGIPPQVPT